MVRPESLKPNLSLFPPDLLDRAASSTRLRGRHGVHLPHREGIEHITALWNSAHRKANQYYEDERWDVYNHHAAVISDLVKASEVAFGSGQYDLAYQALGHAEGWVSVDLMEEMLQTPISQTRERLGLRDAFFIVDFDHTLVETNIAHERLRQAVFNALPATVREQPDYDEFNDIFERFYQGHQLGTGMHKPEVLLSILARYFGLQEVPQEMSSAYMEYVDTFRVDQSGFKLFEGAYAVLDRLGAIGGTCILTFGDESLQRVSTYRSGITEYSGRGNVVVAQDKSPDTIYNALRSVGYKLWSGYVIGIGDRPSDAAAIKAFDPKTISIRVRNPAGKYSLEEPKKVEEVPDFEFQSLIEMDNNLHLVFKRMLGK